MSDTFEFDDQNHAERFVGTLHDPKATVGDVLTVQADKSIAAQPGGGGSGGVQTLYEGDPVSILDGFTTALTWDTLASGTDLLDRSTLDAPTFLAGGTYAVSVLVTGDALTVAGYAVNLIRVAGVPTSSDYTQAPADAWGTTAVAVAAAGDTLEALVGNHDGAATRDFAISVATVVKL